MTARPISSQVSHLKQDGYALARCVYTQQEVENLRSILSSAIPDPGSPGRRLFGEEWARVSEAALTGTLAAIISQAFADKDSVDAKDIKCIRATLFDKTAEANWKVPWHQDLTIPIEEMPPRDVVEGLTAKGFGPWTAKDGIPHVQPPVAVLEHVLAARIHLDPCGLDNGALRVLAGSHQQGRLDAAAIQRWRGESEALADCVADLGDVLLMQPLLLHASSPASNPARRRVLHLEFATCDLPAPLQWRRF